MMSKMSDHFKREYAKSVIQYLFRITLVIIVILTLDAIGLSGFLVSKGQFSLSKFNETLTILLLLEGTLIGAGGAFMFLGYSEVRVAGQAALNPAVASDQVNKWRERRLSQQKWGVPVLIAGLLLFLLGLLMSFLGSI
jgi:hypothetical protein